MSRYTFLVYLPSSLGAKTLTDSVLGWTKRGDTRSTSVEAYCLAELGDYHGAVRPPGVSGFV